jgi:hypothetical protein
MSHDSAACACTVRTAELHEVANWAPFGAGDVSGGSVDILVEAGAGDDAFSVLLSAPFSRTDEVLTLGEVTASAGPTASGVLAGASATLVAAGFAVSVRFGSGTVEPVSVAVTLDAEDGLP